MPDMWNYTDEYGDRLDVERILDLVQLSVDDDAQVHIRPQDVPAVAQALYQAAELEWPGDRDGDLAGGRSRMVRSLTGRVDALGETEHRLKGMEK